MESNGNTLRDGIDWMDDYKRQGQLQLRVVQIIWLIKGQKL